MGAGRGVPGTVPAEKRPVAGGSCWGDQIPEIGGVPAALGVMATVALGIDGGAGGVWQPAGLGTFRSGLFRVCPTWTRLPPSAVFRAAARGESWSLTTSPVQNCRQGCGPHQQPLPIAPLLYSPHPL